MRKLVILLIAVLFSLFTINRGYAQTITPDANNIIYVNKNVAGGTNDGSSWTNAVPLLSDALKYARTQNNFTTADPLQIWVAAGIYVPQYSAEDGNYKNDDGRNNSFVIVKNVQLFGGFDPANGITAMNDRNWAVNPTVLSGDRGVANDSLDNCYHVLIATGDLESGLINGFYIIQGHANGANSINVMGEQVGQNYGGGLFLINTAPFLKNTIIARNTAKMGGGVAAIDNASPSFLNVSIVENVATQNGGGVVSLGTAAGGTPQPLFTNVTVGNNKADKGGGVYTVGSASTLLIYNSIIFGNMATSGNNNLHIDPNATIDYSLIEGSAWNTDWGTDGGNNVLTSTTPFLNAGLSDYGIECSSSGVDAGDNAKYTAATGSTTDKDLGYNSRINNTTIDMGAFEATTPNAGVLFGKQNLCVGSMIALTVQNGDLGGTWISDNPAIATVNDGVVTAVSPGNCKITYEVTNSCGTDATSPFLITVKAVPNYTISKMDPTACGNADGYIVIDGLNDGDTYYISYMDGNNSLVEIQNATSTGGKIKIPNLPSGSYTDLLVQGSNGCTTKHHQAINLQDPNGPTISAGNDTTVCVGSTVVLTANNPDGATLSWNHGVEDGTSFVLNQTGHYVVTAELNGCTSVDEVTLTAHLAPTISGVNYIAPSQCGKSDGAIVMEGLNSGTTYTLNYKDGDGTPQGPITKTAPNSGVIKITGIKAGSYTDFKLENSFGCSVEPGIVINLSDPNAPSISANNDTVLCKEESIILTANNPDNATISWDNGVQDGKEFTPDSTMIYTVTAEKNNCFSYATVKVVVRPKPQPYATTNDPDNSFCIGEDIALDGYSAGATVMIPIDYSWHSNTGFSSNLQHDTVFGATANDEGEYTVIAKNIYGCVDSAKITVTVHQLPTVNARKDTTICSGYEILLNADGAKDYIWSPTSTLKDSIGASVTATVEDTTMYYVVGTDQYGCSDTDSVKISVKPSPKPPLSDQPEYSLCYRDKLVIKINNLPYGVTHQWLFNGEIVSKTSDYLINSASANDAGVYTMIAIGQNGCQATSDVIVNVELCEKEVVIPEAFSPNEDGKNDAFIIEGIKAYPNTSVWIYNRWGAKVFYSDNYQNDWKGNSQNQFNVGGGVLPEGTYYYVVKLGESANQPQSGKKFAGYIYLKR